MFGNHFTIASEARINYEKKFFDFRIDSEKREIDSNMLNLVGSTRSTL